MLWQRAYSVACFNSQSGRRGGESRTLLFWCILVLAVSQAARGIDIQEIKIEDCDPTPETCRTVWDVLTCDSRFSLISGLASAEGVDADVVFGDPGQFVTFFAVEDVFAKDTTVLPGLQGLGRLEAPLKQSSILSMTYLDSLSPTELLARHELVSALQVINGSAGPHLTDVVKLQPNGKIYVNAKGQLINLTEYVEACNGYVYPVDRYWFKFVDRAAMNSLRKPIPRNPAIRFRRQCNTSAVDLSDAYYVLTNGLGHDDMFGQVVLNDLTASDASVTLFISPHLSHSDPVFRENDVFDWSYLMSHMLPGAWCPEALVEAETCQTLLGMATDTDATLRFDMTPNKTIRVYPSGTLASEGATVVAWFTTCRSVLYVLDKDFTAPVDVYNASSYDSLDAHSVVADILHLTEPYSGMPWRCQQLVTSANELLLMEYDVKPVVFNRTFPGLANNNYNGDMSYEELLSRIPKDMLDLLLSEKTGGVIVEHNDTTASSAPPKSSADYAIPIAVAVSATVVGVAIGFILFKRLHRRQLRAPPVPVVSPNVELGPSGSNPSIGAKEKNLSVGSMPSGKEIGTSFARSKGSSTSQGIDTEHSQELMAALEKIDNSINFIIQNEDLHYSRIIGQGSFGEVYLASWKGVTVAVKKLPNVPKELVSEREQFLEGLKALQKEVSIIAGLRHPNIVMFLGVGLDPPCLVQEYCHQGSLYHVLRRARSNSAGHTPLDWKKRLMMATDAAVGMAFLHCRDPPILHCDLKSPNLLVDKTWHIKVADFGLSRIVEPNKSRTSLITVNPRWVAPEVIQSSKPSPAADVFSFGIILWELLTFEEPYSEASPLQIMFAVVNSAERPDVPDLDNVPGGTFPGIAQYVALMQRCWAQDPDNRPSFTEICSILKDMRKDLRSSEGLSTSTKSRDSSRTPRHKTTSPTFQQSTSGITTAFYPASPRCSSPWNQPPVTSPFASAQPPRPPSLRDPGVTQSPPGCSSSQWSSPQLRGSSETERQLPGSLTGQSSSNNESAVAASGELVDRLVLEVGSDTTSASR